MTTTYAEYEFSNIVKKHLGEKEKDANLILKDIKKIQETMPSSYGENKIKEFWAQRRKVLLALVAKYISHRFAEQYPTLDDKLFDLKRYLLLDQTKVVYDNLSSPRNKTKTKRIVLPLFACVSLADASKEFVLGTHKVSKRISIYSNWATKQVNVKTTLPGGIPDEIVQKSLEVKAEYHQIMAECYVNPLLGRLVDGIEVPRPELKVIWIPTVDSLVVEVKVQVEKKLLPKPSRDPALVLSLGQYNYLVDVWDVGNKEEPFAKYFREFSEGTLPTRLK